MKYALLLLLAFASVVRADIPPTLQNEFLARLKSAAQSEDRDRYRLIGCTDGLSEDMVKAARTSSEYTLSEIKRYGDAVKFEWAPPTKDVLGVMEANGFRYIPNLKIEDTLIISWRDTIRGSDVKCIIVLGVKEGRLMQVGTIKEAISKK